jgi:hypothetical protein
MRLPNRIHSYIWKYRAMKSLPATLAIVVLFGTLGCNVGNAPSGMSESDAKAAIANMKPEDRIRAIASSPMKQADKEREYAKIESESGVKASEVLKGGTTVPGR